MFPVIARWTILPGRHAEALAALAELADAVQQAEPSTWMYTIHTPSTTQQSLPTPSADEVVFFSVFADADAFQQHLDGPLFGDWSKKYSDLFLTNHGFLFVLAEYLDRAAGFVRPEMVTVPPGG